MVTSTSVVVSDKKEVDKEFQEALERDKRKWKVADLDGDGSLNLEEFVAFIHPEEVPRMRDIVIEVSKALYAPLILLMSFQKSWLIAQSFIVKYNSLSMTRHRTIRESNT